MAPITTRGIFTCLERCAFTVANRIPGRCFTNNIICALNSWSSIELCSQTKCWNILTDSEVRSSLGAASLDEHSLINNWTTSRKHT